MPNTSHQPEGQTASSRKRGRPPGSVTLTPEIQDTICNLVRAGVFANVAAETAGISPRTFRDWMARGEGAHKTRSTTPKLRAFAHAVRRASAEARAAAEIRVYHEHPRAWLARAARSTPEREGWTDLPEAEAIPFEDTIEGRIAEIAREETENEQWHKTSCTDPECPCRDPKKRRSHAPFNRPFGRGTD